MVFNGTGSEKLFPRTTYYYHTAPVIENDRFIHKGKTMKIKYLKLKNWLLASLAGLLGINVGCKTPDSPPVAEYGCPSADYIVKGTVTDSQNKPVSGITVSLGDRDNPSASYGQTVNTAEDGTYEYIITDYPENQYQITLRFSDFDGSFNGLYADTLVDVSFKDIPYTGGSGRWYQGTATATVDVRLRKADQ